MSTEASPTPSSNSATSAGNQTAPSNTPVAMQQQQQQQQQSSVAPTIGGVDTRNPVQMAEALAEQMKLANSYKEELAKYRSQETEKKSARGAEIAQHLNNIMNVIGQNFDNVDGKLLSKEKAEQFGKFLATNPNIGDLEQYSAAYEVISKASEQFSGAVQQHSHYKGLYEKEKARADDLSTQLRLYQVSANANAGITSRFQTPEPAASVNAVDTISSTASAAPAAAAAPAPAYKRPVEMDLKAFKRQQTREPEQQSSKPSFDFSNPENMDALLATLENRRQQMAYKNQMQQIQQSLAAPIEPRGFAVNSATFSQAPREINSMASSSAGPQSALDSGKRLGEGDFDFYLKREHAVEMLSSREK